MAEDSSIPIWDERAAWTFAEQTAERLAKLEALAAALLRMQHLSDVAETVVGHLPRALGTAAGAVLLHDEARGTLELISHFGLPDALLKWSVPIDGPWAACIAVRTGQPQWMDGLDDIGHRASGTQTVVAAVGLQAAVALPLQVGDRVLGAMTLGFPHLDSLSHDDRVFALSVAALCAQAIDRAEAYTRLERSAERAARLQQVTAAFSWALTPYDVATVAVTQGCAALGAPRGSVAMIVDDGAALEMLTMVGYPDDAVARWRRVPMIAATPMTDAARSGTALFFETMASAAACYPALPFVRDADDHAFAALPLDVNGRVIGVLGLVWDEARRFDADEQGFILSLSRQCAQALDRARLYDALALARADAEAAGRSKDEFLSTVSHDLRTPLTAIVGWASVLRSRPVEQAAAARALATIERNATTLGQLVEDILDVSRMASDKLRLDVQPSDAGSVVRAALEVVRVAAETGGVHLEADIDEKVGVISVDPVRLQQVTLNLLSNAVKFTSRGGRVALGLERHGDDVVLRVQDSGKGIDAAFLPHVFERFRQADTGNARAHGGLGLGLAIVKHLVELHDGTIVAESEGLGRGATVTVTLPAPAFAGAASASAGDRTTPAPPRLDGLRVLVVDDNPDAREVIAAILHAQGARVRTAASAPEALSALQAEPPDVLVSDIGMPNEDGYALLRRTRALSAVPALALTAYAGLHDARMAELAGFDRHLAKPVAPAKLIDAVARLAGRT